MGDAQIVVKPGGEQQPFDQPFKNQAAALLNATWIKGLVIPVKLQRNYQVLGEGFDCIVDECNIDTFGTLHISTLEYADPEDIEITKTATLYSYFWNDAAKFFQKPYRMFCVEGDRADETCSSSDVSPELNQELKETFVIDGFGDASMYIGEPGQVMRDGMLSALCIAYLYHTDKNSDFLEKGNARCIENLLAAPNQFNQGFTGLSFISKSLGSRVLFDTLSLQDETEALMELTDCPLLVESQHSNVTCDWDLNGRITLAQLESRYPMTVGNISAKAEFKKSVSRSVSEVFMFANQLPLIGLARVGVDHGTQSRSRRTLFCELLNVDCANDVVIFGVEQQQTFNNSFFDHFSDNSTSGLLPTTSSNKVTIVAFTDPGDILGFKAGAHIKGNRENSRLRIFDIQRRNAVTNYLGRITDPRLAHAKEDEFMDVAQLVWCGGRVSDSGNVKAQECPEFFQ